MLLAAIVLGAVPRAVTAQEISAAEQSLAPAAVQIRIGALLASSEGGGVDPRLVSMRPQLGRLFPHYSSYQLLNQSSHQVEWGQRVRLDIPGDRYILVIPKRLKDDRVSMRVIMVAGRRPLMHTALSLKSGATLLVGGPRDEQGSVLIVAIEADPVR